MSEPQREPTPRMAQSSHSTRALFAGLILCGVLLIGIVAVLGLKQAGVQAAPTPTSLPGVTSIDPPRVLKDFTLTADDGNPLSLSDLGADGKYTMLFFGYTHCPDYCPLTLADWKQIKTALGDDAAQVNFLFISVDAPRDTPEVVHRFVKRFDESFIGMTGDDATLTEIARDYGLYYQLNTEEGENYSVDHTTQTYLVDPQGQMIDMFSFGTDRDVVVQTIRTEIAKGA